MIWSKLPNKLSECILVALRDLEKCEKNPKYKINMRIWHSPEKRTEDGDYIPCNVCFAGAVMANTLKVKRSSSLNPSRFSKDVQYKLDALDEARVGHIENALKPFSNSWNSKKIEEYFHTHGYGFDVAIYYKNPKKFKDDMRELATNLKEFGL